MAEKSREFLFYWLISATYMGILYYESFSPEKLEKVGITLHKAYGGRLKFLTFINLNIQTIYCCLSFINIFMEQSGVEWNFLQKLNNFIYTSIAFPCASMVSIVFWSLYLFDRELIYPSRIDNVLPQLRNHLVHTTPLISITLDNLVKKHDYKEGYKAALPTLFFAFAYAVWVFIIAYMGNIWVYPILSVLSTFGRLLFVAALVALSVIYYRLGYALNSFIWSLNKKETKNKQN